MKHRSYGWKGSIGAFEEAIGKAIAVRGGEIELRQIGGIAKYLVGAEEWRAEWLRLVDPVGVRLDLYAPDDTPDDVLDAEAVSLSGSEGQPINPEAARPLECSQSGCSQSGCTNTGEQLTELARNVGGVVAKAHSGAIASLVAGGLVVAGGAVVLATLGSRRGVWRSVGVGGLVVGGALVAGGAALWALVR